MPGLGAIRGVNGAVLLFSVLALTFLIIGLVVPDWMNYDYSTAVTPDEKRNNKMGLFVFTPPGMGKCTTDQCKEDFKDEEEKPSEEQCKAFMKTTTKNDGHSECSYYGDGYCRCPYPEDNHTVDKRYTKDSGEPEPGVCQNKKYDDYTHDNMKEYAENMKSTHTTAVVMLILAIVLVGLAAIIAIVGFVVPAVWILPIVGAIFLFLALIFAIVGLIMGTAFTNKSLKQDFCGSDKAWDDYQELDGKRPTGFPAPLPASIPIPKFSDVNSFGAGPIFVVIGIIFLFFAAVLACISSGLAKKLEKVVNIDVNGDGRIG